MISQRIRNQLDVNGCSYEKGMRIGLLSNEEQDLSLKGSVKNLEQTTIIIEHLPQ